MADRPTRVGVEDTSFAPQNPATKELQQAIAGLVTSPYDYMIITYDVSNNPTILVYKSGGAGGITVATVTVTYDGSNNPITLAKT